MKAHPVILGFFYLMSLVWGSMAKADAETTGQPELSQIIFFVR
jgi:hypothetical protein